MTIASDSPPPPRPSSDVPFYAGLAVLGGVYLVLVAAMLGVDVWFVSSSDTDVVHMVQEARIRASIKLSLITCTLTAILSLWVAVPLGYVLSRYHFRGKALVDALIDVPVVLPPMVVGLSLLVLFARGPGLWADQLSEKVLGTTIVYAVPAVVIAQFAVSAAFAVRTMRVTFDQISPRQEQVARTLGCSRSQAFWWVVLPQAWRGMITAGTLAWARALGEFGPVYVFAGIMREKTEVMATSVYMEFSTSTLERAMGVSILMVVAAVVVLVIVRVFGMDEVPHTVR